MLISSASDGYLPGHIEEQSGEAEQANNCLGIHLHSLESFSS